MEGGDKGTGRGSHAWVGEDRKSELLEGPGIST